MARFVAKRLGLTLITLFILSVIVFAAAQLLPGDVGRNVLGPFADQHSVDLLNHQVGADRPVLDQYVTWIWNFVHGDMGKSLQYQVPVWSLLKGSLENSLKLAAEAFVLVVPLSIIGGVVAALRHGRPTDRAITITGLSLTAVPEFVSAIFLIVIFGVFLGWLPVNAQWPAGTDIFGQMKYLLLPSLALVMVLFGYIARMARAGTIDSLESDYTRTAYLKGLGTRTVVRRHVLRNSLLPTIAVVATQCGYLIGGLLVIEKLFNYNGIGQRIYVAAQNKDVTMLQSGVLIVGLVYLIATFLADLLYSLLNPRIRYGSAE
jgi:peptide/nickel transport system permease protein